MKTVTINHVVSDVNYGKQQRIKLPYVGAKLRHILALSARTGETTDISLKWTEKKLEGSSSYHPHSRHICFLCLSENSDPYWKVGSISWKRTNVRPIANCSFVTADPSADVSNALSKTIRLNLLPRPFLPNLF